MQTADKFYFRCRTNPTAPLLTLETEWEAKEMRTHPDYDAVDEDGLPFVPESQPEVVESNLG